eukprot:370628-Alexandrium_andersonii.AAC.1
MSAWRRAANASTAGRSPSALLTSQRSILAQVGPARLRRTGGPHQVPSRLMTAPTAAAEASGQRGTPFAPRSRPTA